MHTMMCACRLLLRGVLMIQIMKIMAVSSTVWLRRPDTVYACSGDDVTFAWRYNPTDVSHVDLILWKFLGTGKIVLGNRLEAGYDVIVYHNEYRERAFITEADYNNAGLILKKASGTDAGEYRVELFGSNLGTSGIRSLVNDTATLVILGNEYLKTTVYVDNAITMFGSTVSKAGFKIVSISVQTSDILKSTIIISTAGAPSVVCINTNTCNTSIDIETRPEPLLKLMIAVSYDVCQPREDIIYIQTEPGMADPEGTRGGSLPPAGIVGIVLAVLVCVVLIALVSVWVVLYKKKSKGYVLSEHQRKYVDCKVFTPLKRSLCSGVRKKRRKQSLPKVPSSQIPDLSLRTLDKEFRSLTKEDITVVFDHEDPYRDEGDGVQHSQDHLDAEAGDIPVFVEQQRDNGYEDVPDSEEEFEDDSDQTPDPRRQYDINTYDS